MVKPNLFIPGFAKCGTSSLHAMLSQHEEIYSDIRKEPHFYTHDYKYRKREKLFDESFRLQKNKVKYILDSSTGYSVYPKAIKRIYSDTPEAKFIILCRDPFERVVSHYNWMSSLKLVEKPFFAEVTENGTKKYNPKFHFHGNYKTYIEASKYGTYIENIFDIFGEENVLVLKFEYVFNDWANQKYLIADFLNLQNFGNIEKDHKNRTKSDTGKSEPLFNNNGIFIQLKREIGYLLGLKYRPQIIKNPKNYYVKKDEIDLSFLLNYLEKDIKKFQELGFTLDGWETTKKYLENS